MHQHAVARAFADLAQTTPALGRGAKVDLAGVLDGDHMPARHGRNRPRAPAVDQAGDRHILVGEKPTEAHLPRPIAGAEPTQASALARDHAFEQRRPLLLSRRSRNSPNDRLSFNIATPRINEVSLKESQTRFTPPEPKSKLSQSAAALEMCACRSRTPGARPYHLPGFAEFPRGRHDDFHRPGAGPDQTAAGGAGHARPLATVGRAGVRGRMNGRTRR